MLKYLLHLAYGDSRARRIIRIAGDKKTDVLTESGKQPVKVKPEILIFTEL